MQLPQYITRHLPSRASFVAEGLDLDNRNEPATQSTRSQNIEQDILSGTAICSICTDPLALGSGSLLNIWDCKDCRSVFHYQCVKSWENYSKKNNLRILAWFGTSNWRCPNCSAPQDTIQGRKCWCRKQSHAMCEEYGPNACGSICARKGKCGHGREKSCLQICHPGPCLYPCTADCPSGRIITPKPPNAWNRMRKRFHDSKTGTVRNLVEPWLIFLVAYALLAVLLIYHIKWHTQLYKYSDINRGVEELGLLIGLILVFGALNFFLVTTLLMVTTNSVCSVLNLNTIEGRREPGKNFFRHVVELLLFCIFVGLYFLPFIGFVVGPDLAWRHQMNDSCRGMDIRVAMDKSPGVPATKFIEKVQTLPRYPVGSRYEEEGYNEIGGGWYLGQHIRPTSNSSNSPFQYYTRLSGRVNRADMAVDVDIANKVWRIVDLSGPDPANEWMAYESKKLIDDKIQTIRHIAVPRERVARNGTFVETKPGPGRIVSGFRTFDRWTDLHIPELEIVIRNMNRFLAEPNFEPFLRVVSLEGFNSSMTAAEQGEKEIPDQWTSKPHDREIMRMAAFGKGRSHLTMCVRGAFTYQYGKPVLTAQPGMKSCDAVPLAIIAALRQRYIETEKRMKWTSNLKH